MRFPDMNCHHLAQFSVPSNCLRGIRLRGWFKLLRNFMYAPESTTVISALMCFLTLPEF